VSSSSSSGGITSSGALVLIFITLKLTGVIGWSWWWVLSPIWITFLVAFVAFAVIGLWPKRKTW
jgi:hypothetical protein